MGQCTGFSSLSSALLARKGGARPAMRSHMIPLDQLRPATAETEDDLGWNDMGDEASDGSHTADIVPIRIAAEASGRTHPGTLSAQITDQSRRRRAAFTLRLDAERHLQLRLAGTMLGKSAQAIVTEALDRHLATMPGLAELAGQIRNRD